MKSAEIRQAFLDFFSSHGHQVVPSSSLVPTNDPSLLFTNAGMVQFKQVFLGQEDPGYVRAVSSQRCVRAGGKHNDLENVGYTARHHTFFEMLGNFSFGDYFKREAIHFAWEFLTDRLNLPAEKLWVTVYRDDDEAAQIWADEIGVPAEKIIRCGEKDNFWSMGETGPCGPCSEIFYDHGEEVPGGPPGSEDEDGDRYVEIWNLVFMQYDRDAEGQLNPLPKPSVDTGMGLERIAAVQQHVKSNYDIDLFQNLIGATAKRLQIKNLSDPSLRVISDHIRSCGFLIVDGVVPANEGRGYVLRRIIRRALRHGHKLGSREPFFHQLVAPLVAEMGEAYPELAKAQEMIEKVLLQEERRFAETLDQGMAILQQEMQQLQGDTLSGELVFKLYDTYGFPLDLTADVAREHQLKLDNRGFERAMEAQRTRARAASRFTVPKAESLQLDACSEFNGYDHTEYKSPIESIVSADAQVEELQVGESGLIVLKQTPFYAESGGQVGDVGRLHSQFGEFVVQDTQKLGDAIIHLGSVEKGVMRVGDKAIASVDTDTRARVSLNHSATHLLHAALRRVLGGHVTQKGSLVDGEKLRFDFAHFEAMTADQLQQVTSLVNAEIRHNHPIQTRLMSIDDATEAGAMALFGEKYGDEVRVLSMGDFSIELCGGIHAARTGDIGLFVITLESGIAAGVRRIEAITGEAAIEYVQQANQTIAQMRELLRGNQQDLPLKVQQLNEKNKSLEKEIAKLKGQLAAAKGSDLTSEAQQVAGVQVLAKQLEGADPKALREMVDQLKNKLKSGVVILACVTADNKVSLVAGVTQDLTAQVKAGDLVKMVAQSVGGKGGGRADMAQGGGTDPTGLQDVLAQVPSWVQAQLA